MISRESEIWFIVMILTIKDKKSADEPDPSVATITEAGFMAYRNHGDKRVRDALSAYLSHPRHKPIVKVKNKEPALV